MGRGFESLQAHQEIQGSEEILGVFLLLSEQKLEQRNNVEYKTLTEGTTAFDIRFVAYASDTKEPIKIIVNIEAQKKHNPGYSLVKRGVFHGSRLMSSQYSVEFEEPN